MKKILMFLVGALLLMLVSGILGGIVGYNKGLRHCEGLPTADTVVVERIDTVTLVGQRDTLTRIVWKPYPVAVHDTTLIHHHTTDSIWISLPYEHRYMTKEDTLEVWYSGIDPKIDSAKVYMHHTTEVVNHIADISKMPRLTLDMGATAFYSDKRVNPCLVGEIRYNAPRTSFSVFGAVDPKGNWAAGVGVTYRLNLIK